ncbi:hypothetical protein [Haloarcula sp. CBA1115]|uniref:Hydrogenase maturation nickel metallochaperone HypA n=2 Tax=Haloarcula hispanica TaxID=51589 RepID=G0HY95_HALHT|nr:hypothetical protein [Haloarcula sp. CBA1115]AEM58087.1 hypothetical protein HAH_2500 [Haloarcula hispanica ATCC 33960]
MHERSALFLLSYCEGSVWSSMGLFDNAVSPGEEPRRRYTCLVCQASFDVQYHSCPDCGAYDIRRTKWLT